jgi:hypothetical protein
LKPGILSNTRETTARLQRIRPDPNLKNYLATLGLFGWIEFPVVLLFIAAIRQTTLQMTSQERVKSLHDLYRTLSGLDLPCSLSIEFRWQTWLASGFDEDALRLVIEYLRRGMRDKKRSIACLRFSYLIQDTDLFAEHLSMARALARKPVVDAGRAQVLRSTGRPCDTPQTKVRTAGEVLRGNEALKELLKLRDNL